MHRFLGNLLLILTECRCHSLKNEGTPQAPILVKEEEPEVAEAQVSQEVKVSEESSISIDSGARKRTTAAERLARMHADPHIKTIEKHRARCGVCDKWVKLQNKTEYDPHNWFAHIKKCAIKSKFVTLPSETWNCGTNRIYLHVAFRRTFNRVAQRQL